jgi:peptide/nickel transport system ATP-binding protein
MKKGKRLESIRGSTPDLLNVPKGCSFGPRCDEFKSECAERIPDMITVEEGHCARCIHCKGGINI